MSDHDCPRCGATGGEPCRSVTGTQLGSFHGARVGKRSAALGRARLMSIVIRLRESRDKDRKAWSAERRLLLAQIRELERRVALFRRAADG